MSAVKPRFTITYHGLTMVELVVVLGILALLTTISLPIIGQYQKSLILNKEEIFGIGR